MHKTNKLLHLHKLITLMVLFTTLFFITSCTLFTNHIERIPNNSIVNVENLTQYDFKDSLKTNGPLTEKHLPSKGDVDVLVVPISFHPELEDKNLLTNIDIAFNGTKEQTGYHSVKSFYKESSYNQLNLNFDVLNEFYKPLRRDTYYERSTSVYGSTLLFEEVLDYYDNKIDFTKYDNDSDGYIDSVWMIYTHPVDGSDFWWAYVSVDQEIKTLDNVKGYVYGFAGIDFLDPLFNTNLKKYPYNNIILDTHTYIHETGHMFGLDDYYDYDEILGVNEGGTYGFDYMDFNYGDHGPINKLLLDWVNPIIVNDFCDIEIKPYQTSGEVYLLTKAFKGTIYDSYYLIINYSNDGLYALDPYFKLKTLNQTKEANGILVYEINAEKNIVNGRVEPNGGIYDTGFKYDNSDENKLFVNMIGKKESLRDELLGLHLNLLLLPGDELVLKNVGFKLEVKKVLDNKNITISLK